MKGEVGDRTEGNEASDWAYLECRWMQIWVVGCVDGGRVGEVMGVRVESGEVVKLNGGVMKVDELCDEICEIGRDLALRS